MSAFSFANFLFCAQVQMPLFTLSWLALAPRLEALVCVCAWACVLVCVLVCVRACLCVCACECLASPRRGWLAGRGRGRGSEVWKEVAACPANKCSKFSLLASPFASNDLPLQIPFAYEQARAFCWIWLAQHILYPPRYAMQSAADLNLASYCAELPFHDWLLLVVAWGLFLLECVDGERLA